MRKTSDAQLEATAKYHKKTDERYDVSIRKVDDADIIAALNELFSLGFSTSEAFKILIRDGIASGRK